MIKIKVPASSANIGPGFDSMGIALTLYNDVIIEKTDAPGVELAVLDDSREFLPTDKRNYVYAAMDEVFKRAGKKLDGYKITLDNKVPVTRGLGSSSAGIVAGLAGANHILGNPLSKDELLKIACKMDGHPDNVAPALLGGYVVAFCQGEDVHYIKTDVASDISFGAMIPDFYFRTKKSRGVLPRYIPYKNAVFNISHAAYLAAAFCKNDLSFVDVAVSDKLHQDYRIPHIKGAGRVMELCRINGANACYLSGAGPTIMSLLTGDTNEFESKMNRTIQTELKDWSLIMLKADNDGVKVFEE